MLKLEEFLFTESRKKDAKILLDGEEVDFGHPMHLVDLKRTLEGLVRLRDCYTVGSGARLTFSHAINRIRKLVETIETRNNSSVTLGV